MRVDGVLKLDDGRIILLEIKYALNWKNCCNARVEIQRFLLEKFSEINNFLTQEPERALIIFDHFNGVWKNKTKEHKHETGWNRFYEEEEKYRKKFPTIPQDIAQLTDEGLRRLPKID